MNPASGTLPSAPPPPPRSRPQRRRTAAEARGRPLLTGWAAMASAARLPPVQSLLHLECIPEAHHPCSTSGGGAAAPPLLRWADHPGLPPPSEGRPRPLRKCASTPTLHSMQAACGEGEGMEVYVVLRPFKVGGCGCRGPHMWEHRRRGSRRGSTRRGGEAASTAQRLRSCADPPEPSLPPCSPPPRPPAPTHRSGAAASSTACRAACGRGCATPAFAITSPSSASATAAWCSLTLGPAAATSTWRRTAPLPSSPAPPTARCSAWCPARCVRRGRGRGCVAGTLPTAALLGWRHDCPARPAAPAAALTAPPRLRPR